MRHIVRNLVLAAVAVFVLIQFVPYGRDHSNPPVTMEPAWNTPGTRALVAGACLDCHGNETTWPWYSNIAPVSWLVQRDVDEGREELNFSEWDQPQKEFEKIAKSILKGKMPLWYYTITHLDARLSDQEKQDLIDGLEATLLASPPVLKEKDKPGGRREEHEEEEEGG